MSSIEVSKLESKGLGQAVALPLPPPRPRRNRGFWILVGLFLTVVCLMMLSPFIWTIMSVTKPTDVAFANPPVFAYQPTMTAFVDLWQTTDFYKYLINTIVVAVISTIVALVIGLPAAYALSRFPGWVSAVLLVLALIFQVLRRVMIPLMGPGILTAGIFVFLFAFQEYLTALILTDVNAKTVPVFIATQLGQTLPMLQQAGAAAMLLTLPVIAIAFIAQKYLVAGLNAGAVKG